MRGKIVPGILGRVPGDDPMKRIVLTGFRGTGKTAVGKALAELTSLPFIDTDDIIPKLAGKSIPEIFREDGEERFRALERHACASIPVKNAVISTGGGVVLDPENVKNLRRDSTVVLLVAPHGVIEQRLVASPRPALTDLSLHDEIIQLLRQRKEAYRASADLCFDTGTTTARQAAEDILSKLTTGALSVSGVQRIHDFFSSIKVPTPERTTLEEILQEKPGPGIMGVAGNPCLHSKGPHLFNALFARYHLNYHYTWFEHPSLKDILATARDAGAKGMSVTIPFKHDAVSLVDDVDYAAHEIGAVNTIVLACGETVGYNTDWVGICKPIEHLRGADAVLLGAGGVASAAAYALTDLDMDVTILNRTPARAQALADKFDCRWKEWDQFDSLSPDLVINATPIGMEPDTGSPLTKDQLRPEMTVFDLVYTPPETPLLKMAAAMGCTIIPGTGLFAEQAKEQFRLFFGIDVPGETIREIIA